ncbi:aldo/keto reductase [Paenibacillus humicola]|uniref:aldo/keto reductase n=1 Tax=Paenibacillus humicola TaxID=3110540 RepID=UPI00237A395D|nr:aldo/keto reductase [Paenibacillus humicola]
MEYVNVQGLDQPVSRLILGSGGLSPNNMDYVRTMLEAYRKLGGNTVDLAYIYGGGACERAIGLWLAENGRDAIHVWTKGAHHDQNGPRVNKQAIYEELMESLERLQTDYVDLYALHRDDPSVPVGEILEALNEHIEAGRMKAIGASNWTHRRLQEAGEYAASHGLTGFAFSSPNLSLAKTNEPYWADCVSADEEMCAWHERTQLPLFSWSSQARGFFSGRFSPEDRSNADMVRVFYNDGNWERLRRAERMAAEKGVTPIQLSLAYVLNQPFPAAALIGPANIAELQSCYEASQIRLSREELRWLDLSDGTHQTSA